MEQLTEIMYNYAKLSHAERVQEKMAAKNLAKLADWKIFINNYIEAHNLAVEKIEKNDKN